MRHRRGLSVLSLGKKLNKVRDRTPERAEAQMGARALKRLVKGFTESCGKRTIVIQPKMKPRSSKGQ